MEPVERLARWLCREYNLTPPVTRWDLERVARARGIRILIEPGLTEWGWYVGGDVNAIALKPESGARHLAHELAHALAEYSRRNDGALVEFEPDDGDEERFCRAFAAFLAEEE